MHDRAIEALPPRFGQIVVLLAEYEERGLDFRAPSQHRYEVGDIGRLGPQGRQIQADSQRAASPGRVDTTADARHVVHGHTS
ncbi:hypothetical protein [Nocardia farcinica]|uniref:hypothetical protein n=1 Tax=Nocardia farcinica TaxID=37329 RepID=UPI001893846C|nr:hypothetical protein [Nocardia farcinica]MBF6382364.1 hypothetical protein [Nocardia farcinica]